MDTDAAVRLFLRLGVRVDGLTRREFTQEYFALARRYHPDRTDGRTSDLMANINAARSYLERFHQWRDEVKK
jgi:curved DNA-binding protein CbpA